MKLKLAVIAFSILFLGPLAKADSVWTYVGQSENRFSMNPFLPPEANPCGCAITGTVTLANEDTATAWSFTVGQQTFDTSNSTFGGWFGFVDPRPFGWWRFGAIGTNGGELTSIFMGSITDAFDRSDGMFVGSNPGTWTEVVSTPEPSSLLLLAAGLGLLAMLGTKVISRAKLERLAACYGL